MRISTKTLASLLLVTAVAAAVPGITSKIPKSRRRQESQFDRLLQRHDRKGELRAEVLGLSALTFRELQKQYSLRELAQQNSFADVRGFRLALLGKLKSELRNRGWSARRIEQYMLARSSRLG